MDLSEIKKKYPREWVLIEYKELDEDLQVKRGHVIAHSANRDDIYEALNKTSKQDVAVEYTGPVQGDLTVMFFFVP